MLGLGSSIITSGAPSEFLPNSVSGLQLWLAGSTSIIEDSDGTGVVQWTDQSSNSNHATQPEANDSFQPVLDGGGVSFDGSNDFLTLGSEVSLNQFHIFLVLALDSHSTDTIFGEADAGDFLRFGQGGLNNSIRLQAQSEQINFTSFTPVISTDGTKQLFDISRAAGTTNNCTLTVNGSEHGTASSSNTSANQFEIDALGVRNTANRQHPAEGIIYEIIIYNSAISSADAASVRNYLNSKFTIYS